MRRTPILAALFLPLVALAFYAASYRRLTRLAIEGRPLPKTSRAPAMSRLVDRASHALTAAPAAAAVCAFTVRTLVRSRQHRMLICVWIGVALALTISAAVQIIVRFGWSGFDTPCAGLLAGHFADCANWTEAVGRYHSPANKAREARYSALVFERLRRLGQG